MALLLSILPGFSGFVGVGGAAGAAGAAEKAGFAGQLSSSQLPYTLHLSAAEGTEASNRPEPGYFDDLVISLFAEAGLDSIQSRHFPWKRVMEITENGHRHVIYPATRTEDREAAFKWVGPVSRTYWNLYGTTQQGWTDKPFDTILKTARIGVLLGSARAAYLKKRGAQRMVHVPREELLLPMLLADRIDLIAMGGTVLNHYVDSQRAQDGKGAVPAIKSARSYRVCYLYVALSPDTPVDHISRLQKQLDRFKENGLFLENRRKHGLSTNPNSSFLRAILELENNDVGCIDLATQPG